MKWDLFNPQPEYNYIYFGESEHTSDMGGHSREFHTREN